MPGLRDGFEAFWVASDEELGRSLTTDLVVVDTNILLDLYRVVERTRDDMLRILERLGDRLWVPHQVAVEFWRNRISVLGNPDAALTDATRGLEKAFKTASDSVRTWERLTAGDGRLARRLGELQTLVDEIAAEMEAMQAGKATTYATADDPVVARLLLLLDGKVGEPPGESELAERIAEGRRRVAAGHPPGYLDAAKDEAGPAEGSAGDYLVWCELVAEAHRRASDVLFVTRDVKQDWWWRQGAATLGPRTELSSELRLAAGTTLRLLDLRGLLSRSSVLDVVVAKESIEDADRLHTATEWTTFGVEELLRRLDQEGRGQGEVIRAAAENDGWLSRDEVYRLCGFEEDRMLRGFTRPVRRITADLQKEGVVPLLVATALEADYEGVRAAGFVVPGDIVRILTTAG